MDAYSAVMLLVLFTGAVVSAIAAATDSTPIAVVALALAAVWVLMSGGW